jgi:hypothetical protein
MKLSRFIPILIVSILMIVPSNQTRAQAQQRDNLPRTASISGRVTVDGKPATNASVIVAEVDPRSQGVMFTMRGGESRHPDLVKARTDSDGRYSVKGLAGGSYMVRALSSAYITSSSSLNPGWFRQVTLDEGESRENVDFALVRGGVITGRVTDVEGRPLIAGIIAVEPLNERGESQGARDFDNWEIMQTDDRGIYRIFGLPSGRYIISANSEGVYYTGSRKYSVTYYPDVTDRKQARVIEVKEGEEVAGIDIRLGVARKTYAALGRVVDAETGQPLSQTSVMCMAVGGGEHPWGHSASAVTTDDRGRFQVSGLPSGRYALRLGGYREESAEHYSEKTPFEVTDGDVSGLEVRAIRGSVVNGVVVIEGANEPADKAKLTQMMINVRIIARRESVADGFPLPPFSISRAKIAGDGSFRATGLAPGMATFQLWGPQEHIFSIKRVELNGAELKSAIEIGKGEHLTGVRIVLIRTNATIRGEVKVAGGNLPEGWQLHISASPRRAEENPQYPVFHGGTSGYAIVDDKGRFVIERLTPGEYELTLNAMVRRSQNEWSGVPWVEQVKQRVVVGISAETLVTLTFDPARKRQEGRQ